MKKLFCALLAAILLMTSTGLAEALPGDAQALEKIHLRGSGQEKDGVALNGGALSVTWKPAKQYRIPFEVPVMGVTVGFEAVISNLDIDLELNAAGLGASALDYLLSRLPASPTARPLVTAYNFVAAVTENSDWMIDTGHLVDELHVKYDLSYELSARANTPEALDGNFWEAVGEITLTTPVGVPLGPTPFMLSPFASLEFAYTQSSQFAIGVKNRHLELDYAYNGGAKNISGSYSPGEPYMTTQEIDNNRLTLSFGVALDMKPCFSLATFQYNVVWEEKIAQTLRDDQAGRDFCRDVSWDVYGQGQFCICPGVDIGDVSAGAVSAGAYMNYTLASSELGDVGATLGTRTSVYANLNFPKTRIPWTLKVNNYASVESGETAHLERDYGGKWQRVDHCTHDLSITLDPAMPGMEVRHIDCSAVGYNWNLEILSWIPHATGWTFLGWYTPDGVNFFDGLNSHTNPPDWTGELVLTARWEKIEVSYETSSEPNPTVYHYNDVWQVDGSGLSNPAAWYDQFVSTHSDSELISVYHFPFKDRYDSEGHFVDRYFDRASYFSSLLFVANGGLGGPELKDVVLNERVRRAVGYCHSSYLETIYYSDSVQDIGYNADCVSLRSVRLPAGLTFLQDGAFKNCISLKKIDLPDTITDLGQETFLNAGLTSVTIPKGVKELKQYVFNACASLESVQFTGHLDAIGYQAFINCASLKSIDADVSEIGGLAFGHTYSLKTLKLHGDTLRIAGNFLDYSGVETVEIEAGTLSDGIWLTSLSNLETVHIKAENIQGLVHLTGCSSLRSVVIECGSCEEIEIGGCASLTELVIRNTGTVEKLTVSYCGSLPSLKTDGPVAELSVSDCVGLTALDIAGNDSVECSVKFDDLKSIRELNLPDGVRTVEETDIDSLPSLVSLTMPAYTVFSPSLETRLRKANNCTITRRYASGVSAGEGYVLRMDSPIGPLFGDTRLPAGKEIQLPEVNVDGMSLVCWYVDGDRSAPLYAGDSFTMPARDTVLYAWLEQTFYSLTVDEEGALSSARGSGGSSLLILPGSVKKIKAWCLWDNGFKEIYLPAETVEIEPRAFMSAEMLERITVDPDNPVFYSVDGVLYSRDGALVAVPINLRLDTLALPKGLKTIRSYAFNQSALYNGMLSALRTVQIPASVTTLEENWFVGLEGCDVYGPETGPVAEAALAAGLRYNVFPVVFMSRGECVGMVTASAGTELPALSSLADDGSFLGWSAKENGSPLTGPLAVPYGGMVVYALWAADIPIDEAHFPDAAFREYVLTECDRNKDNLLDHEEIHRTTFIGLSVLDDQISDDDVPPARAEYIRSHYMYKVKSTKGIEYFTRLRQINAECMPQLTTMDLSANNQMERVYVHDSGLAKLTLGSQPNLIHLNCENNALKTLNVSQCPSLEHVYCQDNKLTKLTLGSHPALKELIAGNNQLTGLQVKKCPALKELRCYGNQLTAIDLAGNPELEILAIDNNRLTSLNISKNKKLRELYAYQNELTALDASGLASLEHLACTWNEITDLNVSGLGSLRGLYCSANQLRRLDLTGLTALEELECVGNQLTALDVRGCGALKQMTCNNNQLSSLLLNANIKGVSFIRNPLYVLDISACPHLLGCMEPAYYHETEDRAYYYQEADKDGEECWMIFRQGTLFKTGSEDYHLMVLPAELQEIEEEAFSGVMADIVVVPQSCTAIRARAFANCPNLKTAYIPADAALADDAFEGCANSVQVVRTE